MSQEELTAEQACREHLFSPEDFLQSCNPDGSLKSQPKTTTITLKNDPSKSITINNSVLQATVVGIVLVAALLVTVMLKRRSGRKV